MKHINTKNISSYEESYKALPFEDIQAELRCQEVLFLLKKYKPKTILEVGCGLKPIFVDYNEFDEMVVVEAGQDFAQNAEDLKKNHSNKNNITIINEFLEDSNLENYSFDVILIVGILHEIPDIDLFMKTVYNITSDKSTIIVNVPNANSFHRQLAVESGLIPSINTQSEQQKSLQQNIIFNQTSLTNLLQKNNLKVTESKTIIFKPFSHQQMQQIIDKDITTKDTIKHLCSMMKTISPDAGSEILAIAKK